MAEHTMNIYPLWKGESFDQFDPHGAEERWCPVSPKLLKKIEKKFPGRGSIVADTTSLEKRREAVLTELTRARVAYRRVAHRTNSRTMLACLIPPRVLLADSAPYLCFVDGNEWIQSAYLGLMNSLPFDWQARRYIETNINYYMLESLIVPPLDHTEFYGIAKAAARLSAVDERFSEFAQAVGVETGPLSDEERQRLRVEIDALVARAWDLTADDLKLMFTDFTLNAVPLDYRESLLARLEELS